MPSAREGSDVSIHAKSLNQLAAELESTMTIMPPRESEASSSDVLAALRKSCDESLKAAKLLLQPNATGVLPTQPSRTTTPIQTQKASEAAGHHVIAMDSTMGVRHRVTDRTALAKSERKVPLYLGFTSRGDIYNAIRSFADDDPCN